MVFGILLIKTLHFNHIIINISNMNMKAVSFNNLAVVYVKGNAYRINFAFMTKDDASNKMNNANLKDKSGVL